MMNLLVVDDELLIREEIKSKINRLQINQIGKILLAANGVEAKQIIYHDSPSIVITDIKMPEMDGLTLIKECFQENISASFIMLSGYDDYSLVREAFKFGAIDYLLKPIKIKELQTQLEQVIDKHSKKQQEQITQPLADMKQMLNTLLSDHPVAHDALQDQLSHFTKSHWTVCSFRFRSAVDKTSFTTDRFQTFLNEYAPHQFILLKDDHIGGVFLYHHDDDSEQDLLNNFIHLQQEINDTTNNCIIFALSNSATSIYDIRELYLESQETLGYRLIEPNKTIFHTCRYESKPNHLTMNNKILQQLLEHIRSLNVTDAKKLINDAFDEIKMKQYSPKSIKQLYFLLNTEIYKWHSKHVETGPILSYDEIDQYQSIDEVKQSLVNLLVSAEKNLAQQGNQNKPLIHVVKKYIEDRIFDNISLTEVSNLVSLNYSYFSTWFKEETGETFSNYVMKTKMNHAKRLLEDPYLRINEVASKVGYDNNYHFSRAFKNYYGISPKAYRSSIHHNDI